MANSFNIMPNRKLDSSPFIFLYLYLEKIAFRGIM
jgi:hypothetical protein